MKKRAANDNQNTNILDDYFYFVKPLSIFLIFLLINFSDHSIVDNVVMSVYRFILLVSIVGIVLNSFALFMVVFLNSYDDNYVKKLLVFSFVPVCHYVLSKFIAIPSLFSISDSLFVIIIIGVVAIGAVVIVSRIVIWLYELF